MSPTPVVCAHELLGTAGAELCCDMLKADANQVGGACMVEDACLLEPSRCQDRAMPHNLTLPASAQLPWTALHVPGAHAFWTKAMRLQPLSKTLIAP